MRYQFAAPKELDRIRDRFSSDVPKGMAQIAGGTFRIGSDAHYSEERPAHSVVVDSFWIDRYAVTNADFAAFISATGYVTFAERPLDPALYPGADPDLLKPGSAVFSMPVRPVRPRNMLDWWKYIPGADWRHPEGPGSTIAGRQNEPVVHIAFEDAAAYAVWAGKDLPTEAEWEFAARGGLESKCYVRREEFKPGEKYLANTFPANGYGLDDMAGNVWQWCRECVVKGGPFLCNPSYPENYQPSARWGAPPAAGSSRTSFRCVASGYTEQVGRAPGSENFVIK